MISQFETPKDISAKYRHDSVKQYMSPLLQDKKPHFHYLHEMLFITDGTATFNINNKKYNLSKGSFIIISNLESHSISSRSENYTRYSVLVSNEFLITYIKSPILLSIFKQRPEDFCHHYRCAPSEFPFFCHIFESILQEITKELGYWNTVVANRVNDLLIFLFREHANLFPTCMSQQGQDVVLDIQSYIESHLDQELSLDVISDKFFINKYYLSHIFKDITGYTFKKFIVLSRLSKAKELLLYTNDSIKTISSVVGFNNVSHFIRSFKFYVEITPLQYRKNKK